ncbi:MAG: DNA repair protein RecN [Clostridium sp.]
MLNYINIKNIGIISDVTVEFYKGLNILTGETGAGKTLIIDSLLYASGAKFSKDKILKGKNEAVVNLSLDIDGEEHLIYRKFQKDGKNLCKIDEEFVSLKTLREYMLNIIDIHGQKENQSILEEENQIQILDQFMYFNNDEKTRKEILKIYNEYTKMYCIYKESKAELKNLEDKTNNDLREIDILKYEIGQIESASISVKEKQEVLEKYNEISNYEKIYNYLTDLNSNISNSVNNLSDSITLINNISKYSSKLEQEKGVVENSYYELEEVQIAIDKIMSSAEYDEKELDMLTDRINTYTILEKKYGGSIEKVIEYLENAKKRLEMIENKDDKVIELKEIVKKKEQELILLGRKLFEYRERSAKNISEKVTASLHDLEMKNAIFKIVLECDDNITKDGTNTLKFMISTNKQIDFKEISKIASGGEMSRIMLALKEVFAQVDNTKILVFDEIDTGISGNAGQKVGIKMAKISKNHQVLCVTHLASIASLGDNNIYISKEDKENKTETKVQKLETEEEVLNEVARIIGGKISQSSLTTAKELRKIKEEII